jgi:CheY-like chemotaxis protein
MGDGKKILVVDDNRTIKLLLEKRLVAEGYVVVTASDGREGLSVAAREMPDLVLSDVDMPVMDGGEMVSKLKGSIRTSHIPVIFLTSLITKDENK